MCRPCPLIGDSACLKGSSRNDASGGSLAKQAEQGRNRRDRGPVRSLDLCCPLGRGGAAESGVVRPQIPRHRFSRHEGSECHHEQRFHARLLSIRNDRHRHAPVCRLCTATATAARVNQQKGGTLPRFAVSWMPAAVSMTKGRQQPENIARTSLPSWVERRIGS